MRENVHLILCEITRESLDLDTHLYTVRVTRLTEYFQKRRIRDKEKSRKHQTFLLQVSFMQ